MSRSAALIPASLVLAGMASGAGAAPLIVPFDFSRSAIALDVSIGGRPVHMLLDTGVDPSLIDLGRADELGIAVDRHDGGEATGFGDGKGAAVFPSRIDRLTIGDRSFPAFEALAADTTAISNGYGGRIDGILGYSFVTDKIVLIDYPDQKLGILSNAGEAKAMTRTCRTRWSTTLRTVDSFPVIPGFRIGSAKAPVTFDTGSNGGIALFGSARELPGVAAALQENGSVTHVGARGDSRTVRYRLAAPVGFGPFSLPAGQAVTIHAEQGSRKTRVANIGNKLMAEMKLKVLLDYRARRMAFYGACG